MAAVMALRHFRVYLLEIHFKVVTDCNALRVTFTKCDLLWLETQKSMFDIEYRAGQRMACGCPQPQRCTGKVGKPVLILSKVIE